MTDKRAFLEELFRRYGAEPTELDPENREIYGTIYAYGGAYYQAGTASFDGRDFLVISCIDKEKFAALGLLEDIDVLPADSGEERLEKAVRYALGVEPYPPRYPE